MISLSDAQLKVVMAAARQLPVAKREIFLWRVSARLQLQRSFTNDDVDRAVRVALIGLVHEPAA